jgi:hypothetical protein
MTFQEWIYPWFQYGFLALAAIVIANWAVDTYLVERGRKQHERNNKALREAQLRLRQSAEE